VLSEGQARRRAAAEYFKVDEKQVVLQGQCASVRAQAGQTCLNSELIYYAPPIDLPISQIAPHYLFSGSFVLDGTSIEIRKLLIPAIENAPQVELTLSSDGVSAIEAKATVKGGKAPYSYAWMSSTTTLPSGAAGPTLSYKVAGREAIARETLSVVVTDGDGLSAWTSQAVAVSVPAPAPLVGPQQSGKLSVGAEWVGLSQNLPYAQGNVGGFLDQVSKAGVDIAFNFGEQSAYQSDFSKDTDEFGIDSVDLGFYTGHANGLGFSFDTERKKRFFYSDLASWGEKDLEWLIIAACGPLQETGFGIPWWKQWGQAFAGLHLMLAYGGTTYDNNREGRLFGQEVFEKRLPLRQAWANTATSIQTADEVYGVMGVWGSQGVNNYNDHFWGLGAVGPDIPRQGVEGYWRLSGPS
jgi:hypothetical protein